MPRGGNLAPNRRWGDIAVYNAAAAKVMAEEGVATIDDLYAAALPGLEQWLQPGDIHFTEEGSKALATEVVASIEPALSAAGNRTLSSE